MWLPNTSVKRPVFATMVVMALVVLGAVSYPVIGVDLVPRSIFRSWPSPPTSTSESRRRTWTGERTTPVVARMKSAERLELQEVRDQVDDARRAASLARQDLLPQLDVLLGFTRSGASSSWSDAWNVADHRVSLGFATSYPLETTAVRTRAALAEIDVEARRRGLRQGEEQVEAEVRNAVRSLDQIRKTVGLQRRTVEVAEQQYRLALLRYERGLAFLGTLGNNAPFVGLFGTVLGIVRAFHDLSMNSTQGTSAVMAGIAESLVAIGASGVVCLTGVGHQDIY